MKKEDIIQELLVEKKKLTAIINDAQRRLKKAPDGYVRIIKHGQTYQFYVRKDPLNKIGVYLPVAQRSKAVLLMQKTYDKKILSAAQKQLSVINNFLNRYDPEVFKDIYKTLSDVRKTSISLAEISDEEYIKNWQTYDYEHKPFEEDMPEHYTSKGERVRSKSEVMIADALNQAGIAYRYECPLILDGRKIHPDFTVLRAGDRESIYWEHLGMMDVPEYCHNAIQRIRLYEANEIYPGINLILTLETSSMPINLAVINHMIRRYCQ